MKSLTNAPTSTLKLEPWMNSYIPLFYMNVITYTSAIYSNHQAPFLFASDSKNKNQYARN